MDAYAARGPKGDVTILLTNHALPRHPIAPERVDVTLARFDAPPAGAYVRRVDEDHANPRRLWETLGCPKYPSGAQVTLLEQASACVPEPLLVAHGGEAASFTVDVTPHGIAAVTLIAGGGEGDASER